MENIKKFRGNELALAGAVKEDLTCSGSSPLNKAISPKQSTDRGGRAPLLKSFKPQAKRQASSQASSLAERQASSVVCGPNRQAPSMAFRDGR